MKFFCALLLIAPLQLVAAGAAGPPIVGAWNCAAKDSRGMETSWKLIVKQDGGKLAASLTDGGVVVDVLDPKLEGDRFTFRIPINPTELVQVVLKLDGDRLEGTFAGKDSGSGTFKGTRIAAPDISGTWSGDWNPGPGGGPDTHYMVLKQDGDKVTGTAGPNADQQAPISNGRLAGDRLTFDIAVSTAKLAFDLTVSGDTMSGSGVLTINGTERKLKLTAKRAH